MATKHHPTARPNAGSRPPAVPEAPPANLPIPPVVIPTEGMIRVRAYELWEADGRPDGDGVRYWLEAERELSRGR